MERRSIRRLPGRKLAVLAAVVCLLAGISAAAAANGWFGLRELEFQEPVEVMEPDGDVTEERVSTGLISLQGYSDTPEYRAMEEWQAFLSLYDRDGTIIDRIGNTPTGFEEDYLFYQVYTREMADKLEEICEKYGLSLHTVMVDDLYTDEALCDQVGGDFLGENRAYSAYMYEDGTFKFDGEIDLPDYGVLDYQFMRCVRGSLTDVVGSIGNTVDYTEWGYTTASGIPATLALAPYKGVVILNLPDSFVTINVLAGTETPEDDCFSGGPFMAEDLERFADSFDFSLLTPARPADPDLPRPTLDEALGRPTPEEFFHMTGVAEPDAQAYYCGWFRSIEAGDRRAVAEQLCYPAVVTVEEGTFTVTSPEEFLPYYERVFTAGLLEADSVNRYTKERVDLFSHDGMIGAAGGAVWMAATEDGLLVMTVQNPEGWSIRPAGEGGISAG